MMVPTTHLRFHRTVTGRFLQQLFIDNMLITPAYVYQFSIEYLIEHAGGEWRFVGESA